MAAKRSIPIKFVGFLNIPPIEPMNSPIKNIEKKKVGKMHNNVVPQPTMDGETNHMECGFTQK